MMSLLPATCPYTASTTVVEPKAHMQIVFSECIFLTRKYGISQHNWKGFKDILVEVIEFMVVPVKQVDLNQMSILIEFEVNSPSSFFLPSEHYVELQGRLMKNDSTQAQRLPLRGTKKACSVRVNFVTTT